MVNSVTLSRNWFAALLVLLTVSLTVNFYSLIEVEELSSDLASSKAEVTRLTEVKDNLHEYIDDLEGESEDAEFYISALKEEMDEMSDMMDSLPYAHLWSPPQNLAAWQEELCLSILIFGEERGGSRKDMVYIANSVYERVALDWYEGNACLVAAEGYGSQFSSMKPYARVLKNIVWGKVKDFTPKEARENAIEARKWKQIRQLSKDILAGKERKYIQATHFLALDKLKTIPGWMKALRPVAVSSGHVFFTEYDIIDGKVVRYTEDNPFNQSQYNLASWKNGKHETAPIFLGTY